MKPTLSAQNEPNFRHFWPKNEDRRDKRTQTKPIWRALGRPRLRIAGGQWGKAGDVSTRVDRAKQSQFVLVLGE